MGNNYSYPRMDGQKNHPEIVQKYQVALDRILGLNQWKLTHVESKCEYSDKLDIGTYQLQTTFKTPATIASFKLVPMINCCGMVVSTQASVVAAYQGRGLGTLLNSLRIDIARHCGYGCMLCTDVESNTYQRRVLARNGWLDVHKFVNPRTKNTIFVSVINL